MIECWKDIVDYEGYYQVSNTSKIRSLDRVVNKKVLRGKVLEPIKNRGYLSIMLSRNNMQKIFRIHRLIATAFIPNPYNKPFVNHKNGIRDDNRIDNLEWVTTSENHIHAFRVLNRFHGNRKKIIQLSLSDEPIKEYESSYNAASCIGRSNKGISNCLTGRSKTAYGYKWKYA